MRSFNEVKCFSGIFSSSVFSLLSNVEICHSGFFVMLRSLEKKPCL